MKLSDFSVNRPVLISMAVLIVMILGFVSVGRLAVDLYPEMNLPIAAVITNYEGAAPQEVETLISRPLEEMLGTVSNVDSISSTSSPGSSMILMWFKWGTDMDQATLQMREKIDFAKRFLPKDMESPMVFKADPSMMPIIQIGLSGGRDLEDLNNLAEDVIKPRLERLEGVASLYITGGKIREIQVLVDPLKLKAYHLSLAQVTQAIRMENMNLSNGDLADGKTQLLLRTMGEFRSINDIENLLVANSFGVMIPLKDISQVQDSYKKITQYTRMNGQPSLGVHIIKQTGSNIVQVSDRVLEQLEEINKLLPSNVKLKVMVDSSDFVRDAIKGVIRDIAAGGIISILVLFFFLGNARSTIVVSLSIPISIISTFILMYFNNMTLNMLSLGGLALGVGRIVDDSIVILENIYRHRQEGHGLIEAAKLGSSEVASAVMASTFTTVVVFLPIVFVEGIAAQLFKQLALTVTFSLLASLVVSLTLIPMLSSKLLKVTTVGQGNSLKDRLMRLTSKFIDALDERYRKLLIWALAHRKSVVITVVGTLILSIALIPAVGMEFMPKSDTGELSVTITLPKGSILDDTSQTTLKVEKILDDIPEVKEVFTSIGPSQTGMGLGGAQTETSQIRVLIGPASERTRSADQISDLIRSKVASLPGAKFQVAVMEASQGMGGGGKPVNVSIKGDDLTVLSKLASQVEKLVQQVPGTREVENSLTEGTPEVQIVIDRQKAQSLGFSVSSIANTLRGAVTGEVASRYKTGGSEYDITVKVADSSKKSLEELKDLIITSPGGVEVPIGEIAAFKEQKGPNTVNREDQARVVSVSADIIDRDLASIVKDIQNEAGKLELPEGYFIEYGGQNEEMMNSFIDLGKALALAIILVYMVMAAQFESLFYPFIIMFSMPTMLIGVILGLVVTGRSLSVPAFIGVIMLSGIVVSNAILLVDYINTLRKRGIARNEAIVMAGPTRLRPILMTTLTTVLGMLPLALGLGEGSESQAPMATVVVSGLTFSTLLTLVLIPVVYTLFDDLANKIKRKLRHSSMINQAQETGGVAK